LLKRAVGLKAQALRENRKMSTRFVIENILKRGKEILQDILGKSRLGTIPSVETRIPVKKNVLLKRNHVKPIESNNNNQNNILIGRLFPNVVLRPYGGELRRRLVTQFNQYGRLLRPTFAFGFAGLALQTKPHGNDDDNISAEVRVSLKIHLPNTLKSFQLKMSDTNVI